MSNVKFCFLLKAELVSVASGQERESLQKKTGLPVVVDHVVKGLALNRSRGKGESETSFSEEGREDSKLL
jgi:hypothetical protein